MLLLVPVLVLVLTVLTVMVCQDRMTSRCVHCNQDVEKLEACFNCAFVACSGCMARTVGCDNHAKAMCDVLNDDGLDPSTHVPFVIPNPLMDDQESRAQALSPDVLAEDSRAQALSPDVLAEDPPLVSETYCSGDGSMDSGSDASGQVSLFCAVSVPGLGSACRFCG